MSRNPFKTDMAADDPLTLARVADMVAGCTPGYRLVKFLGAGSYGRVYLLEDALKQVVVKLVPLTYRTPEGEADRDASGWDWFQLQSRLDHMHHPSLVRVRDFFRVDSTDVDDPVAAYGLIYMDYWAASLRRCVRRWHRETRPPLLRRVMLWQQVVRLVRDVQRDTGLLYTDLKPANILMSDCTADAPRLVLGDPGGLHRQGGAALDRVDATRKYLPPEVQDGMAAEVDERALIFSLGIIGFFILEGRLPFSSLPEDAHAHVRVSEGVALDWQDSSDDPLLVQVQQRVAACLAVTPAQRPASFAVLYDQLAQLARQVSVRPVSLPPLAARQPQAVWQEPASGLRLVWVPG